MHAFIGVPMENAKFQNCVGDYYLQGLSCVTTFRRSWLLTEMESSVFKSYRSFLLYCGTWPYDNSTTKLIQRVVCSLNFAFFLLLQINTVLTSDVFLDSLIDLAPLMLLELVIIVKFLLCWIKENYYKESFEHMRIDWGRLTKNEELPLKRAYEEFVFYSKFLFFFVYVPSIMITIFLFFPKTVDVDVPSNQSRPSDLIVPIKYFIDSNKYFYPIVIHLSLSILLFSSVECGVDLLNWMIQLHMVGMFNLLGYLMKHLFDEPEDINNKIDLNTVYCRRIVRIIDLHKRNLKLGDTFMRCMLESAIIQITVTILCITGTMLKLKHILSPMRDIRVVIAHCTFSCGVMTVIYLLLLIPHKVHDSSNYMFIKIYCGHWYVAPIKSQKLLLIPMQRYMKPYNFQLKNLLIANVQTLTSMVQAGFSYFTVLYSLRN